MISLDISRASGAQGRSVSFALHLLFLVSCQDPNSSSGSAQDFDTAKHISTFSASDFQSPEAATAAADAQPEGAVATTCQAKKSDLAFANGVVQIMYARSLNAEERAAMTRPDFSRPAFVDNVLKSPDAHTGITRFVSNLLRVATLEPSLDGDRAQVAKEAMLVADLKKEPVELVLRNLQRPWPWFFTTQDIYCTKETGKLYGIDIYDTNGFVACHLPADRAGLLGLASVLRANPSSFNLTNNNYHRVAFATYLAKGIRLLSATNAPAGDGLGIPLPLCVPSTDMRTDRNGTAFGTALVPQQGSTCAQCHSHYNAPMSVAFRRFAADGTTFSFADIDAMNQDQLNGANPDLLKALLNETESCWSHSDKLPPRAYNGLPGLARLISEAPSLAQALGIQVPQMLANMEPDESMQAAIASQYEANGKTLLAAFKGFFLSDSFQCSAKGE